jgi:hypothetical protein
MASQKTVISSKTQRLFYIYCKVIRALFILSLPQCLCSTQDVSGNINPFPTPAVMLLTLSCSHTNPLCAATSTIYSFPSCNVHMLSAVPLFFTLLRIFAQQEFHIFPNQHFIYIWYALITSCIRPHSEFRCLLTRSNGTVTINRTLTLHIWFWIIIKIKSQNHHFQHDHFKMTTYTTLFTFPILRNCGNQLFLNRINMIPLFWPTSKLYTAQPIKKLTSC